MGAGYSVVRLDIRGIRRDHVALATVVLSLLGTIAITAAGAARGHLPGWSAWFPFMVAVSLVSGPGSFGFLFGTLMVDEGDSGVRQALAVAPVPPRLFILIRTVTATAWAVVWPLTSVHLMNWTWQAVDLALAHWLAVVVPLALLAPAFALLIPALADDQVGALAAFKALSFISLIPLALFFVPAVAPYRVLFLGSPTGWSVEAYRAFLDHRTAVGYGWAAGATVYALTLGAVALHLFRRNIYSLSH